MKKNVCIRQIMAFCLASALLATNAFADQDVKQKISEKTQTVEVNVKTALDDGVLNFDEAYKMALENNSSIKNLEANVEVMQDTKSKLVQSVDYVSMPDDSSIVMLLPTVSLSALKSINTLDTNLSTSKYNKEIIEISTAYMLKDNMISIISLKKQLELAEKSYEIQSTSYGYSNMMNSMGMISQMDLDKSKAALDQTQNSIESLKLSIETAYETLNTLIGKDIDTRYEIDYVCDSEPLVLATTIETYAAQCAAQDPYIKIKELSMDDARFGMNAYSYDGQSESYLSKQANHSTAVRAYEDAKTNMEKSVKNTYNSLMQLEKNKESLESSLSTAQDNYEVVKLNFDMGKATQLELDQAQLAVEQAEFEILKNDYNYDKLKYSFENPSLMMMSSAS